MSLTHIKSRMLELRLKLKYYIVAKFRGQCVGWGKEREIREEKEGSLNLQNCKTENRNRRNF